MKCLSISLFLSLAISLKLKPVLRAPNFSYSN